VTESVIYRSRYGHLMPDAHNIGLQRLKSDRE